MMKSKSLSAVGYLAGGLVFVSPTIQVRFVMRRHGERTGTCTTTRAYRARGSERAEVEVGNAHLMSARLWLTVTSSVATKREVGHLGFMPFSHEPRDIVAELLGKLREGGGDEVARV